MLKMYRHLKKMLNQVAIKCLFEIKYFKMIQIVRLV